MSIKLKTPCDLDGICPYADMHSGYFNSCEYWCGADEPEDNPEEWEDHDNPEFWDDDNWCDLGEDGWNKFECEPSRDDWDTDEDYYA